MSNDPFHRHDHDHPGYEALADAAMFGRPDTLEGDFAEALEAFGEGELEALEHAAASMMMRFVGVEPMPRALRDRCREVLLEQDGIGEVSSGANSKADPIPFPSRNGSSHEAAAAAGTPAPPLSFGVEAKPHAPSIPVGWLAAAAAVVLGAVGWYQAIANPSPAGVGTATSLVASRDAMVASGATVLDWAPWGEVAEQELTDVSGTVVWDVLAQDGFMTFEGLPANDPTEMRYQLWIVDTSRGEALAVPPVDGGVFDVPADGGEVVVRIDPKLPVGEAAIFAVTREKPSGVVISERRPDQMVVFAVSG